MGTDLKQKRRPDRSDRRQKEGVDRKICSTPKSNKRGKVLEGNCDYILQLIGEIHDTASRAKVDARVVVEKDAKVTEEIGVALDDLRKQYSICPGVLSTMLGLMTTQVEDALVSLAQSGNVYQGLENIISTAEIAQVVIKKEGVTK